MVLCECRGGPVPFCADCERRSHEWRCDAYLRSKYLLGFGANVSTGNGRAWFELGDGRVVTAYVDVFRDRVVEEVTSGR